MGFCRWGWCRCGRVGVLFRARGVASVLILVGEGSESGCGRFRVLVLVGVPLFWFS